jgi:hypothetical protein
MKGNFHVRFLEESGREIAPSYSAKRNDDAEGRGYDKKRTSGGNRPDRGVLAST